MGVARIEGNKDDYSGFNIWGGKDPESSEQPFRGKSYGIISLNGTLYMLRSGNGITQQCYGVQELWKSMDHGRTWIHTGVDWNFPFNENNGFFVPTFLQFGKDYRDARDKYLYIYAPDHTVSIDSLSKWDVNKPGLINLIRVPVDSVEKQSAYSYYSGVDNKGDPKWTFEIEERQPIFKDSENGVMRISVIYNPGLKRYILTAQQVGRYKDLNGNKAHIGIYESTEPWGPWSTILFEHPWNIGDYPHLQNEEFPGDAKTVFWNFSPKWWSNNGKEFVREGKHSSFLESPISNGLTAKDICIYGAGDLNKIGKEGKTSWDSFSYGIMMGHNVWMHINAVQEANRQYDAGKIPKMLVQETFDTVMFRDIVEAIFATDDRQIADAIIEEYNKYWMSIIGTRGATGKKTQNASTMFSNLFEEI